MLAPLLLAATPLLAAPPAADPPQEAVDDAVRRAVEYLRSEQLETGGWPYRHGRDKERSGNTALALHALLAGGVAPDDEAVRRALANLNRAGWEQTYDAACGILALAAHDPLEHRAWIQELADLLIDWQERAGDWGYPGGSADLSNTQFAALGLRAAALSGARVPAEVWEDLGEAVARYQRSDGSFPYQRGAVPRDTMTAAGAGTLALCVDMLARAGESSERRDAAWKKRIEKGLFRLGEQAGDVLSTRDSPWPYYRLYGVERVGVFTGEARLGELGWYEHGTAAILTAQRDEGSWQHPRRRRHPWTVPQTAWAVLFLRRATAAPISPVGGAVTGRSEGAFASTPADGPFAIAVSVDEHLTVWVTAWHDAARAHERRSDRGRGPRVERVEYWAGDELLAAVEGDAGAPVSAQRFEARVPWPGGAERAVEARATLLSADGSERVELRTPPVRVAFARSATARAAGEDAERSGNLLRDATPRVSASSTFAGGAGLPEVPYGPELAVDGRLRTPWLADPTDEAPTLTIDLRRSIRADAVLISLARPVPWQPDHFARPHRLRVTLGDDDPIVLPVPDDARDKVRLDLDRSRSIRTLAIHLLDLTPGTDHPATGLAEVELLRR